MRNGKPNPKNFPYWEDVVKGLKVKNYHVIQVGVKNEKEILGVDEVLFNQPLEELEKLIKKCKTWVAVDNFFPHLCRLQAKSGIVIFGQSDPDIFGHPENINLLKDKTYLREKQFDIWETVTYTNECFVDAQTVLNSID